MSPAYDFPEATRENRKRFGSLYRTIARNETVSADCIVQSREMKSFRPIVSYNRHYFFVSADCIVQSLNFDVLTPTSPYF